MYKHSVFFVAAIFCCAQCLPLDASRGESSSTRQLDLTVNNSSQSANSHLTPVMRELENIDQEIDDQLQAILPYLNFFFDSLLGEKKPDNGDNDCVNNMVIELVPDETARPSQPNEEADKESQPEDKSEANPDTATVEGKSEDKSDDKPVSKPDVVSTPEGPVDNVQINS